METNSPKIIFFKEDTKIFNNARYLEKFFDEQLVKWLPLYVNKNDTADDCGDNTAKRIRLDEPQQND